MRWRISWIWTLLEKKCQQRKSWMLCILLSSASVIGKCQDPYQVPAVSGEVQSVSNVEHGTKSGRVRRELNLCVGSPVTEAYGKSDDVSESSRSYVGDGQRLCIKHREFFQNDNRKKARN